MGSENTEYTAMDAVGLAAAERAAVEQFNNLAGEEKPTSASVAQLAQLADQINTIREELSVRVKNSEQLAQLRSMVNKALGPQDEEDEDATGDDETEETTEEERVPELVASTKRSKVDVRDVISNGNKLNASLAQAARHAPSARENLPRELVSTGSSDIVITASSDIPGIVQGSELSNMNDLVRAMHKRSRTLKNFSGQIPVATLERRFAHNMNLDATDETVHSVIQAATNPGVLTAAGGWCAPSTISYEFYNIVCEQGLIDLPTIGIDRGGIRFPTSASFGDISTDVWHWNETQDIAAATGTAQSGIKTCFRVACPAYSESRLSCDGFCLTVGNLTQDAFPELIANQLILLMAARAHFTNSNIITQLVTGSTAVTFTPTGHGWAAPLLEAVELQVMDYRIKFRMCDDALLEAVFPTWVLAGFRADLAKRQGMSDFEVTDQMIARWFTIRGVRAQFVQDWQVGTSGLLGQSTPSTAWPNSVQFLLYAAGTWVRGNGLNLDLGVIRDSTLNATNDFTAAWMEDCYLTARVGHESRVVTVPLCANGAVGSQVTMGCTL